MFKNYLIIIFIFFVKIIFGQEINGIVTDAFKNPIPNASLIVYQNENIIAYTYSKDNGTYLINIVTSKKDSLIIVINALGFKSKKKIFY